MLTKVTSNLRCFTRKNDKPVTVMKCGLVAIGSVSGFSFCWSAVALLSLLESAACSNAETSITGTPFTIPAAVV